MNKFYIRRTYILFGNPEERNGKIILEFYGEEIGKSLCFILNNYREAIKSEPIIDLQLTNLYAQ